MLKSISYATVIPYKLLAMECIMEIDEERFSKDRWSIKYLNKNLDSFEEWNDNVLSRVNGAHAIIEHTVMNCIWGICFIDSKELGLSQDENAEKMFEFLRETLSCLQKKMIINKDIIAKSGDADAPSVSYRYESPEGGRGALFALSLDLINNKVKEIPRGEMSKYFHRSLERYHKAVSEINERCKSKGISDNEALMKAFTEDETHKLCIELQHSFIESDLYRHKVIGLKGKALELVSFFKYIYLCCP